MKVKDANPAGPIELNQPKIHRFALQTGDRVTARHGDLVARLVSAAKEAPGELSPTRLRELEIAVRHGAYQPDLGRVAEAIAQEMELAMALRALVK